MNRFVCTAALGLALAALAAVPARAQPPDALPAPVAVPKNSQIDIDYVLPREAKHRPIYDKLRQHRVLETLQEFLAPLRLPRRLTFKVDECGGAMRRAYQPGSPVTICYEYIALIENNAPGGRNARIGPNNITKDLLPAPLCILRCTNWPARPSTSCRFRSGATRRTPPTTSPASSWWRLARRSR
jgi:hypothetical protein